MKHNNLKKDIKKEIVIRIIKIIDIGYVTLVYFILGLIFAKTGDKIFGKFNEKKENTKPIIKITFEIILYLWVIGVIMYTVRNIVPLVPFPLDGIYGFDHLRVKEVTSGAVFILAFISYFEYYQKKIKNFYNRIG